MRIGRMADMERLTGRREGRTYIVGCPDFALPKIIGLIIQQTVDRLAAIEDILGDEYDLNLVQRLIQAYKEGRYIIMKEPEQAGVSRLRELAEADREGKIPKYTIGDTIYDKFGDAWEVTAVERHLLAGEPKWIYRCGHIGTNDYFALWEFEVLTRAEAEAALQGEREEKQ